MRINKFLSQSTSLSRRAADETIRSGRVAVNGITAELGSEVTPDDTVILDGKIIKPKVEIPMILLLNKPVGYVCSSKGQGSRTIYDLLPPEYQHLKPAGRLDKDSSGLLVMTNNGQLAYELTHPKFNKEKHYEVELDKNLSEQDLQKIAARGVELEDGISRFAIVRSNKSAKIYTLILTEGRNRQIRRTFAKLCYRVISLNRTSFHKYSLGRLENGKYKLV